MIPTRHLTRHQPVTNPSPSNELPKLLNQINAELERLNWTGAQYREYLTQAYGEKAFIPDTEFRNIFQHLKSLPSPLDAKY